MRCLSQVFEKREFEYASDTFFKVKYSKPCLFPEGCVTCGGDNPWLPDYGRRYVCTFCQKQLKLPTGESIQLRVRKDGRHIGHSVLYHGTIKRNSKVDVSNLRIFGLPCMATFAGESNNIIVVLN